MNVDILSRVIAITNEFRPAENDIDSGFCAKTAVCQDAMIFGIDVDEYVDRLEAELGDVARKIPWLHSTDQTNSFRDSAVLLIPFAIVWRLIRWPFLKEPLVRRADPENHPYRLTLRHIALVIEKGEWFDP